ncbi:hypothetical protein EZ456_01630 [Pedobacter psychrodurus]|uniref:PKD family protein n=1 Tax=Pedobacter psychrodurus TaxID=2530456 RepID=A0A4R0Q8G4_9SPHI|nr:PKD-like family lipoprotein [Pedobacter psychrodurus]TCD29746.1 hypothetical protein EZ456_01630 [Pedobacter psychrodurus]
MLKKIYNGLFPILIVLVFVSCKKDLGHYDYQAINEVKGFTGIADVTAIYGKRFIMKPEPTFTQDNGLDTSKYSYEWTYIGSNGLGATRLYQMATTRYLDVQMSLIAGNYTFYYGVTDKATGVKYRKSFILTVKNEINEGWFLLCDVNGSARLDMLSLEGTSFRTIPDLLGSTSSGLVLKGRPKMVYNYEMGAQTGPGLTSSYAIYLSTDQSTERIDPENFKWQSTYTLKNEIYGAIPPNFYADAILRSGSTRSYMIGAGNAYNYDRVNQIRYSVPINFITAEQKTFNVAPFIATDDLPNSAIPAIFYDTDNKRFVKHIGSSSACTLIPDPSTGKLFSFTTGMDLVYMNYVPFNGGEVFSVLKEGATGNKYLARFNPSNNAQSYYAQIVGTDINLAENFAVSPDLGYLFYNVGGKLYEYDMFLKTSKIMIDKGTDKISLLKFQTFASTTKYPYANKLIICSYDPVKEEGKNGKMEMFTVPSINGDLVLLNSYSGFGKVKSLVYRTR